MACEDRIPVTNYGARNAMKSHYLIKEDSCHRSSRVGVSKWHKMCILGKPIKLE
uniref:Uncharacterized protein n=1 Tax=Arundo donax TaxID=35708 RepID=A0A0A9A770_ARUDO